MPVALTRVRQTTLSGVNSVLDIHGGQVGIALRLNVAIIELTPLLLLVEVTYFIPSAPLICCSRGTVTAVSTVWALAPT